LVAEFDADTGVALDFYPYPGGEVGDVFKGQSSPAEAEAFERQAEKATRMRELVRTAALRRDQKTKQERSQNP
jgi:hypothetical protein